MTGEVIINTSPEETQVALLEDGQLVELFVERKKQVNLTGNIYKGKVSRVLPGMQSAFVNIGLQKAAFLHVKDVHTYFDSTIFGEDVDVYTDSSNAPIEDILREGEEILVQVSKDPIGAKGARVTSYITLPGRYLVLMPGVDHIGISRRIHDENKRKRLKEYLESIKPNGFGFIARTASEGKRIELSHDMDFLLRLWANISAKSDNATSPALLYSDLNLILRSVRDLFNQDIKRLVIDSEQDYLNTLNFVKSYFPELTQNIILYEGNQPIFETYGIKETIAKALDRRVWLKSGGYIVIDQTEALTAIDVNTGRYVGEDNLEETIVKTNLEAVKEIAYQIRLRNVGGIIVVDFIDMESEENKQQIFQSLSETMSHDRVKSTILKISELGIVEMTRKRIRDSLERTLCEPCHYCNGRSFIKSSATMCYEIFRELRKIGKESLAKKVVIIANPLVVDLLLDDEKEGLRTIEQTYNLKVIIKSDKNYHQEYYEITAL
jgi:ribonuclease G